MLSEAAFGRPLASQKDTYDNGLIRLKAQASLSVCGLGRLGRIGVLGLEFGKRLDNQLNVRKMQEQSILKKRRSQVCPHSHESQMGRNPMAGLFLFGVPTPHLPNCLSLLWRSIATMPTSDNLPLSLGPRVMKTSSSRLRMDDSFRS